MSILIYRKILLHAVNLSVFYLFGGGIYAAIIFSILVEVLPANIWFASRTAIYCSGASLLALYFGALPFQAFIFGAFIALWPLQLMGAATMDLFSPTAILPAGFTVLAYNMGINPIHAYMFGSFVIAKIYIVMFVAGKGFEQKSADALVEREQAKEKPEPKIDLRLASEKAARFRAAQKRTADYL